MFETTRERIYIEIANMDSIYTGKRLHMFAICVTADYIPIIGIRRTSFTYQSIISRRRSFSELLFVDINHLKYMYDNEIKEICIRSITPFDVDEFNDFEELVLLGGRTKNRETIYQCLKRELSEESDGTLTIKGFGDTMVRIVIEDKILHKTFKGYCIICFIDQYYSEINKPLYNIEIKELSSLYDKTSNEKYKYLSFIYNTLLNCKYGGLLQE
ncbi:MutT motif protein [Turkeypox virus]|uniref:MutT motif protein n=1 Tax=Turkeypox virus TaxID=336486 RepID=A0A0M3PB51_9POXV|nr:MutT motif protein [Turkeypox virus]ALA62406.1 MutT motif protein [Turkeypox virus]